jgi:hypothetical protein
LGRYRPLKHVTEGKVEGRIEVSKRRGRRRRQLLDDLKDKRGCCKLITKALDRNLENSLRKSVAFRKRESRMNECGVIPLYHEGP